MLKHSIELIEMGTCLGQFLWMVSSIKMGPYSLYMVSVLRSMNHMSALFMDPVSVLDEYITKM